MKPALLWIVPKWPLPPHDGARRATCALLKGLRDLDVPITLCAYLAPEDKPDFDELTRVLRLDRAYQQDRAYRERNVLDKGFAIIRSLIRNPQLPLTMRHFQNPLEFKGEYHAVVYDGLHVGAHSSARGLYVPSTKIPVIYRAHNRESQIWQRKAELATGIERALLWHQAKRVEAFEDSLVAAAWAVAAVSEQDLLQFPDSKAKRSVVPIGFEFKDPPRFPEESHFTELLYVGKLDWQPNRDGLHWFLKEVWPEAFRKNSSLRLSVVGSGSIGDLDSSLRTAGVTYHGRVDSLDPYYAAAWACIVPIFYGSGTRVKAIEAARFGRSVITTAIGIEGLPLPSNAAFVAETAQDWTELLVGLTPESCQARGQAAFEALERDFSIEAASRAFLRLFASAASSKKESKHF
jgi:glycosyltransferase involved in cell wall biosynthesis